MNRYNYAELTARLPGPDAVPAPNVVQFPLLGGPPPYLVAIFGARVRPDMNAAAAAGMPGRFDALTPAAKDALLAAVLSFPSIARMTDAPRAEWLPLLWALADAERLGAANARRVAENWSKPGRTFDRADFDRDWKSFQPGRIGVGTLLEAARKAGFDLDPWLHPAPAYPALPLPPGGFMQPLPHGPANLHPVPWIVPGLLVRGDLAVLAGQGGGAKTAVVVSLGVALAAGRAVWGSFKVTGAGAPLRVLYISVEENANRLGLLVEAACRALGLSPAERAAVAAGFRHHDARASGWRLGEPRPGWREDMAPDGEDRMRDTLRGELAAHPVDLVVLDTLAGLLALPNENDNTAVTRLLNRLARVIQDAGCAGLLVHHTPKATREGIAAQRGEATLVRGGGAIVNSARVVWSLTSLPLAEAAVAAVAGTKPDMVRRLDPVKLNDAAPPPPAFLEVVGVMVPVSDGSRESNRAVRFIPPPPDLASASRFSVPMLNTAMRAIDAGVLVNGARLPLSPGGGRSNVRDAAQHVAQALRAADPGLAEGHALIAARQMLEHLRDKLGCVEVHDVPVPKHAGGKPNGKGVVRGYVCRWDLAPWHRPDAAGGDKASGRDPDAEKSDA